MRYAILSISIQFSLARSNKSYEFEIFTINAANILFILLQSIASYVAIDTTMILSSFFHNSMCNTSTLPWVVGGWTIDIWTENSWVGHYGVFSLILGSQDHAPVSLKIKEMYVEKFGQLSKADFKNEVGIQAWYYSIAQWENPYIDMLSK